MGEWYNQSVIHTDKIKGWNYLYLQRANMNNFKNINKFSEKLKIDIFQEIIKTTKVSEVTIISQFLSQFSKIVSREKYNN